MDSDLMEPDVDNDFDSDISEDVDLGIEAGMELIPPKGSEGVGQAVAKMLSEIFTYRDDEKLADRCNRFYQMKRSKHWKYENDDLNLLSANLCGTHHKKTVNMLTDNNPTFDIVPGGELGDDGEDKLSLQKHTADNWWNDTEQQMTLRESVDSGELYGTVGEYTYFNIDINYPHGEVDVDTLDLLYMSLYPPKCRKVRKAEGFLRWYPLTVRQARRKWPKQAENIVGDMSLLEDIGDERKEEHRTESPSLTQVVISTVTKWISGEKPAGEINDTDELFIIEAWVKDYSTKGGQPVYPGNIRRVTVCNGGEIVLADDYNPSLNPKISPEVLQQNYYYNRFPVSYVQPVPDPSSPFGLADIEQLEEMNMELNKTLSQFATFKDGAVRLKITNPRDSGVTDEDLNNTTGIIHPTNHLVSQGVRYIDPPQMGSDIPMALTLYKDLFNEIAGSFSDVTQGQKAGSEVVAAKAIALLLETEARMAKGKGQSYQKMIRERGRGYLALAQMWYDTPRYVTFQKDGQRVTKGVMGEDLMVQGKLNVVSGSTLPVSDIYRREESLGLFKLGLIDQEETLKTLDIDNAEDIIKRMKAGPLGEFLEKISLLGVPQELLQIFQQAASMDMKELQKAVKEGKLPPFRQILEALLGKQEEPPPDPEVAKLKIEMEKADAEIQDTMAKTAETNIKADLIKEKIITERVDQQVKVQGVKFDEEKLRMLRAETINRIKNDEHNRNVGKVKAVMETGEKVMNLKSSDRSGNQGPYNEKGLNSNNQEV